MDRDHGRSGGAGERTVSVDSRGRPGIKQAMSRTGVPERNNSEVGDVSMRF